VSGAIIPSITPHSKATAFPALGNRTAVVSGAVIPNQWAWLFFFDYRTSSKFLIVVLDVLWLADGFIAMV